VILRPLYEPARLATRQEFRKAVRWSALLGGLSYRFATRSIGIVEMLRNEALRSAPSVIDPDAAALVRYHSLLLTSAKYFMLASPPTGRPWLADMAKTFTWVNWTPTISLVRERTLWLVAAAVRSAVAFGPEVIEFYDDALARAEHPVTTFDALLGLVSIACAYERSFDDVVRRVEAGHIAMLERDDPYLLFTDRVFRSAREALKLKRTGGDPFAAIESVSDWRRTESQAGLATRKHFDSTRWSRLKLGKWLGFSRPRRSGRHLSTATIPRRSAGGRMSYRPVLSWWRSSTARGRPGISCCTEQ
jgi:hypothetical protein